jgi:putative transposase
MAAPYAERMSRLPRFFAPGLPLHIIQRGNNRQSIFRGRHDLMLYRACLARAARDRGVAIHAYVFMTNHVHLLATPRLADSMPKMMQSIGRIYVKYFNSTYGRSGTLWEGRYKAAIVDDERYLLTCMRYIELNPVRAQMVASPDEFPWSSYSANACGSEDTLVEPHPIYRGLGPSPATRRVAYRQLFGSSIPADEMCNIRDATQHAWALGDTEFRGKIAALTRRAERLPMGRPRKPCAADGESGV